MQAQCVRNIQQQSLRGHRVDEVALRSGPVGSLAPGPGSDHDVIDRIQMRKTDCFGKTRFVPHVPSSL